MMELRKNQKADVVLLKQERHYRLFAAYLCLYRRLHGPEYPQLRVEVALDKLLAWRAVEQ